MFFLMIPLFIGYWLLVMGVMANLKYHLREDLHMLEQNSYCNASFRQKRKAEGLSKERRQQYLINWLLFGGMLIVVFFLIWYSLFPPPPDPDPFLFDWNVMTILMRLGAVCFGILLVLLIALPPDDKQLVLSDRAQRLYRIAIRIALALATVAFIAGAWIYLVGHWFGYNENIVRRFIALGLWQLFWLLPALSGRYLLLVNRLFPAPEEKSI